MELESPDLLALDDLLAPPERRLRDEVRDFVETAVLPVISSCVRHERFEPEWIRGLARLGLFGATIPDSATGRSATGTGGEGVGPVAYGLANRELERGDSAVRTLLSVQSSLVLHAIWRWGSEEQKSRWLPALARGEKIGCFALTEPETGSDPGSLTTRLVRSGDELVLTGRKRWIGLATIADVAVVWAKLEDATIEEGAPRASTAVPDALDARSIRGVLVETDRPGFSARNIEGKWSLRAAITSEIELDSVRLPTSSLLPLAKGLGGPLSCLGEARFGIAWGAVGAAMACYEEAVRHAKTRVQFGRPLAANQLVQAKLVDMLGGVTAAQLLAYRLGRLKAVGELDPIQVSLAKRDNVAAALRIARAGRDLLAAQGILDTSACGRHLLNLESVFTYEGTHDIHTLAIGRAITGLSAFGSPETAR